MRSHRTTIIPNTETPSKPEGFWTNLVKDDNNFSTVNFFLIAAVIVGIIMLIVPMVGLCVDIYYNHTITVNMDALAAYIIAVAGVWGAAGLTNAWTEYSYQKYNSNIFAPTEPPQDPNMIGSNILGNDVPCIDDEVSNFRSL